MRQIKKFVAVTAGVLVSVAAFGAVGNALYVTDVQTAYSNSGVVSIPGFGNPWTTPLLLTENNGSVLVTFCDDIGHTINVSGGQHLDFTAGAVTTNGMGSPISMATSNEMGQIAALGRKDYDAGNQDGAIAAQAAIWGVEYGLPVSASDATIQSDITDFLKVSDDGGGYAQGITFASGSQGQLTGGVPEPATWGLMLLGLSGLGLAMRARVGPARAKA